ncbi:hypothetical protein BO71DRAFT_394199 [Aspergillus ellipticus CBS 707.79]|uniref:Uncharacterized protein n=1 Tax=Aspergillus ellipticus CBS 707.79 TaxID=1448320 RepID=A0A319DQ70_9EURO|nr:hypothetical protein BO71DRAFT_394199 [Aspergillus ellipticus CBS 707.79]
MTRDRLRRHGLDPIGQGLANGPGSPEQASVSGVWASGRAARSSRHDVRASLFGTDVWQVRLIDRPSRR